MINYTCAGQAGPGFYSAIFSMVLLVGCDGSYSEARAIRADESRQIIEPTESVTSSEILLSNASIGAIQTTWPVRRVTTVEDISINPSVKAKILAQETGFTTSGELIGPLYDMELATQDGNESFGLRTTRSTVDDWFSERSPNASSAGPTTW